MDWAKFDYNFRFLGKDVIPDLISIEAYKEAALNLVVPADWQRELDKLNRVRAVHGTTALEGNPLSEAEVSQQIDLLETSTSSIQPKISKEQLQIRNAGIAQNWVRLRFQPGQPPLQLTDILHLHKTITVQSDETHNIPGECRTFPVVVGSPHMGGVHHGAPHERVPTLMDEYIQFVGSRRMTAYHPVIRALIAHFYLVTIHPFGDGNGRVSRLVEAGILFQGGYNVLGFYGLSNYFYKNEIEYKTLLQKCRAEQPFNLTPFVLFGLKGFASELKGINNFIKRKLNRVVYRTMLARAFNKKTGDRRRLLNQREYNLLDFLLGATEPIDPFSEKPSRQISFAELRESAYIKAAYKNVTIRTFYRELLRLADLGFITFLRQDGNESPIIELDFGAIGKH